MPHFSADLLDALLDGDPAELEALRDVLGMAPAAPGVEPRSNRSVGHRCLACRPAPLFPAPSSPAASEPRAIRRARARAATEGQGTGGRPGLPALRPHGGRRQSARHRSGP